MNNASLWKLVCEVEESLMAHFQPIFDRFCDSTGLDGPIAGILLAALSFDPEVISPARLLVRTPYTAAETFMARLWVLAEKGFLTQDAPGEYRLTAIGRARTENLLQEARAAMANADPLPSQDSERLVGLFDILIQSALKTPPPPEPWSIRLSAKMLPPPRPALPYIEQAISCLYGYRDDAHLAAWQMTGLSATALETLTLLWRGEADSLETICQQLARRGHSPQVYSHALEDLRELHYVLGSEAALILTPAGREFREGVEQNTDRFFYVPWAVLSQAQRVEMGDLLTSLRDGLSQKQ